MGTRKVQMYVAQMFRTMRVGLFQIMSRDPGSFGSFRTVLALGAARFSSVHCPSAGLRQALKPLAVPHISIDQTCAC